MDHPTQISITYRHFDGATLSDLGPINVLVGRNNAGKTSVFRAVAAASKSACAAFAKHQTDVAIAFRSESTFPDNWLNSMLGEGDVKLLYRLYSTPQNNKILLQKQSLVYSRAGKDYSIGPGLETNDEDLKQHLRIGSREAQLISMLGRVGPDAVNWLQNCYFLWHRRKSQIEEAQTSDPHDKLDSEAEHLAGRLRAVLAGKDGTQMGQGINSFLNAVVPGVGDVYVRSFLKEGDPDVTTLSVWFTDREGRDRGLDSLGGGVEQVVAIALVLVAEKQEGALFIEEPESHLHEFAQRRLVEQIEGHRGERQVFIATHSPVFMNSFSEACVYRVSKDAEGRGDVSRCIDLGAQREVLDELGVRPSTLLQANAVVWVEGPTEVHLIQHWLHLRAPELRLHIHYEFAETGGANLGHYGADLDDEEARWEEPLHDILKICRHSFAVVDRDAGRGESPSKDAARGLREIVGGNLWVTWGYEIESYLPDVCILDRWGVNMPGDFRDEPFYDALLRTDGKGVKSARKKKPKNAAWFVRKKYGHDVWFSDDDRGSSLKKSVDSLVAFIRRANEIEASTEELCSACDGSGRVVSSG